SPDDGDGLEPGADRWLTERFERVAGAIDDGRVVDVIAKERRRHTQWTLHSCDVDRGASPALGLEWLSDREARQSGRFSLFGQRRRSKEAAPDRGATRPGPAAQEG